MITQKRVQYLRIALVASGLVFIFGITPLTVVWPSGWSWSPERSDYLPMILGLYATLGAFLLFAARDPLAHRSLISFTVWSSVVHAGVMAFQAVADPMDRGHLFGDVPALIAVALVLGLLLPRARRDIQGVHP